MVCKNHVLLQHTLARQVVEDWLVRIHRVLLRARIRIVEQTVPTDQRCLVIPVMQGKRSARRYNICLEDVVAQRVRGALVVTIAANGAAACWYRRVIGSQCGQLRFAVSRCDDEDVGSRPGRRGSNVNCITAAFHVGVTGIVAANTRRQRRRRRWRRGRRGRQRGSRWWPTGWRRRQGRARRLTGRRRCRRRWRQRGRRGRWIGRRRGRRWRGRRTGR